MPLHVNMAKHISYQWSPNAQRRRQRMQLFVAGKAFHIFVLCLVLLDVIVVFTALLLEVCGGQCAHMVPT